VQTLRVCGKRLVEDVVPKAISDWANDTRDSSVACLQRQAILSTGTAITSRQLLRVVLKIVMRPDEESWSGRLADFRRSSLRI
jgi:hypothetical protein